MNIVLNVVTYAIVLDVALLMAAGLVAAIAFLFGFDKREWFLENAAPSLAVLIMSHFGAAAIVFLAKVFGIA